MSAHSVRRAVFATAGHVDHGKTALVRALTGTDTDRLPEEKRRGISIELGFAELPDESISFIDVPGHRRLVHAMIAGVGGVDAVVLVVAADDGVMPQTREHAEVAELLGIRRFIVALTKCDLVDAETIALAEADARELLDGMGIVPLDVIETSTADGRGIEKLRHALAAAARALPEPHATHRAFLSVDRVFSVKGSGTVVTGTLTRGRLEVGQALYVAGPSGTRETVCRVLEVHGRPVSALSAPSRAAVNLARLSKDEVRRGDVVTATPDLPITDRFDASFRSTTGAKLANGDVVVVHLGTTRVEGRVFPFSPGLAHLALSARVPCMGGEGFVLRGFSPGRSGAVLGGGRILDAGAPRLPPNRDRDARQRRATVLHALASGDFTAAALGLVGLAAPQPLEPRELEARIGTEPGRIERILGDACAEGGVVSVADGSAFTTSAAIDVLATLLVARVRSEEARSPHQLGVSVETLRSAAHARAGRDVTDLALRRAEASGRLSFLGGGAVCTREFANDRGASLSSEDERVLSALEAASLEGLGDKDLEAKTRLDPPALRSALSRLTQSGRARRLSGLWFAETALDELRLKVLAHFRSAPTLSIQALKDVAGVSRKQAIPLMEQLDREGTTRRVGDARVAGPKQNE